VLNVSFSSDPATGEFVYALGESSEGEFAIAAAMGLIPGGKLAALVGGIGSSAWKAAKHYAARATSFLASKVRGLAHRAKAFVRRKPGSACGCFVAGTIVWTLSGPIAIEQVEPGMLVVTRDEATGALVARQVIDTIVTPGAALLDVTLEHADGRQERLQTTDEHPFRVVVENPGAAGVRVERWARADTLTPGEQVVTMSGVAVVRALTFTSRRETVYNLAVAGSPTYLVGRDGVWVHNCGDYRKIFIEVFEQSGRKFPAGHHVHHRIPQKYRDMFPNGEVDQFDNWVGVPQNIHGEINGAWNTFRARNPTPTRNEVLNFVYMIDVQFGQYFLRP
jgi:hypothetical protein